MRHDMRANLTWRGDTLYFGRKRMAGVVPDGTWPGMWRVKYRDGSVSDMVNLSRAKDAAMTVVAQSLDIRETPLGASRTAIVTEAA